ncbi:hypothetical protein GGP76_003202 [Salinibacter ruber]|nr:hypothetical protein [Salinibacter ruber]
MPHPSKSLGAPPRSKNPLLERNSDEGPPRFTESKQSSTGKGPSEADPPPVNSEATDPFPPGLFRVPVPDRVFAQMSGLTDAALHCLLALIRLSWRFDPEGGTWVHTGKSITRADIEEACGLSGQGTRQGLSDLEERGWAEVDRSGRSYQYRLTLGVPSRRYTYLPTGLLEEASSFSSTTALRVLLVVFRKTWGWTEAQTDPDTGEPRAVHKRWTRASKADFTQATGRSETAIGQAIEALEGCWISRKRPDPGAHFYRVRKEALRPERGHQEETSKTYASNEMPPHRQRSDPPTSYRESYSRDKQNGQEKQKEPPGAGSPQQKENGGEGVVLEKKSPRGDSSRDASEPPPESECSNTTPDASEFSAEKQALAEKLVNAGVWPRRARECVRRYSEARIEANFDLYRKRAQEIEDDGAWLCAAITDGYADLDSSSPEARDTGKDPSSKRPDSLPPLDHKETLSEAKKDAYVDQGIDQERFHRCPPSPHRPDEARFMYFDPEIGGPTRRGACAPA